jgi:aryl-alcohol dehydrogenase-like predicted oxidoreductase
MSSTSAPSQGLARAEKDKYNFTFHFFSMFIKHSSNLTSGLKLSASTMSPQLISGNINDLDPDELKQTMKEAGITRLDTSARYKNGESEKILGRAKFPEVFAVDTKILTNIPADGSLSKDAIEKSLSNSLDVLAVNKVNVLYCHAPDFKTPIAEQARAFNDQYKKGRFTYVCTAFIPGCTEH